MNTEIICTLKTVVSELSHNSNNDISDCFRAMFVNKAIAEQFSLGRSRSTYVVKHNLFPYF